MIHATQVLSCVSSVTVIVMLTTPERLHSRTGRDFCSLLHLGCLRNQNKEKGLKSVRAKVNNCWI